MTKFFQLSMITVYKGEQTRLINTIDLDGFLACGWQTQPQSIEMPQEDFKPNTPTSDDIAKRKAEIEALPYPDIEKLARSVGVKKADRAPWKSVAELIAIAELSSNPESKQITFIPEGDALYPIADTLPDDVQVIEAEDL